MTTWPVRLNPNRAEGRDLEADWRVSDRDELFLLTLRNCVLASRQAGPAGPDRDGIQLRCSRRTLENLVLGATSLTEAETAGALDIEGDRDAALGLFDCFDSFPLMFDILEGLPPKLDVD